MAKDESGVYIVQNTMAKGGGVDMNQEEMKNRATPLNNVIGYIKKK